MVAGITGHQRLGSNAATVWVRRQVRTILENHRVTQGVGSLAIGADQLFAAVLLKMKIPYVAIVPCSLYAETFSKTDLPKYLYFLRRACNIRELPFEKPSEEAFYEAGKIVVRDSDLLIAVWDGEPARGLGGTADMVEYAKGLRKLLVQVNPVKRSMGLL